MTKEEIKFITEELNDYYELIHPIDYNLLEYIEKMEFKDGEKEIEKMVKLQNELELEDMEKVLTGR